MGEGGRYDARLVLAFDLNSKAFVTNRFPRFRRPGLSGQVHGAIGTQRFKEVVVDVLALVVADPTTALEARLPESRREAIAIAAMYKARPLMGEEATRAQFASAAENAALIHYAGHADSNTNESFGALLLSLLPSSAFAQAASANLTGTIKDASGGVLPGVSITAKNIATNDTRTTVSENDGLYRITNLPRGTYDVKAELQGFKALAKSGILLTVGDTEGFAQRGVAVNLYLVEDQVRFEISRRSLQRHHLDASYHLLQLARLIDDQQALR